EDAAIAPELLRSSDHADVHRLDDPLLARVIDLLWPGGGDRVAKPEQPFKREQRAPPFERSTRGEARARRPSRDDAQSAMRRARRWRRRGTTARCTRPADVPSLRCVA